MSGLGVLTLSHSRAHEATPGYKRPEDANNEFSFLQLISGLPQVEACVVLLHQSSRLLAFIVTSSLADQAAGSPLTSAQHREDQTGILRTPVEAAGRADGDPSTLVLGQLSLLLPSYSVPDTLVVVPALCQTPHGEKSQSL